MQFLAALESSRPWLAVAVGLLGLCVGSFLNVVIHRLPKMMEARWRADCAELEGREVPAAEPYNLVRPNSSCPACGTEIRAWQNIPIVSWLLLRGKCAACGVRISARYPLVEAFTGLVSAGIAWHFGYSWQLLAGLGFAWALVALTFIDFDTQLLPDDITLPLCWAGLLVNVPAAFVPLHSAVLGAVGGYLVLWSVYWGFRILAKKEGMGYGDFKLLAAIGAWTGWQVLPVVIVASAGVGAIVGSLVLWLSRRGADTRIPFGPYLALGGIIGLLWGHEAVVWWLGFSPG
ncbi:MAG TPA: A24 family peptidase [Usitatibacter sp.]|jgi:leader peptidase (prepilin peptidase) / N-methyltransferase|nr:A24 family peptidase [Usitatibacter sp.]